MKQVWIGLTVTASLVALALPALAKTETVTGQLVDSACYAKDKANTGNDHKGMGATCAQDCAKKGVPVALVTTDGKVYQVGGALAANSNAFLMARSLELP